MSILLGACLILERGLEQFLNKRGVLKDGEHATADDPWLSDHWDIIQMNGCFISGDNIEFFQYVDPDKPSNSLRAR